MPAAEQRIGRIDDHVYAYSYATFESRSLNLQELSVSPPEAGGKADCDLPKVGDFMQQTRFKMEDMLAVRRRGCDGADVARVFAAYCAGLEKVEYNYETNRSLFDRTPSDNKPNCMGRAKGFLQLLAICGVPLRDLALVLLGSAGDETINVVQRDQTTITDANVRFFETSSDQLSPNAVRASLDNGTLTVSRTTREPFAYHYCARVLGRGPSQFWDPLFRRAYVNGMNDFFYTVRLRPEFTLASGPTCYVDDDVLTKRLYLFQPHQVSRAFSNSAAYKEVRTANARHTSSNDSDVLEYVCNENEKDRAHMTR
jgi:hypothetical protein